MLRLVRDVEVESAEALGDDWEPVDDQPDMQNAELKAGEEAPASPEAEASISEASNGSPPGEPVPPAEEQRDGSVDLFGEPDGSDPEAISANLGALEALLLGTHHPLTAGRLAELLDLPSTKPIRKAIKDLNAEYESTGRSFRVDQVAGGFQILTLPEYGDFLKKLHQREADAKLTKAALETLALIAYKQPILRANIEAIRGVACGETIRSLMEKHLVKIAGRAEEPGRPILYGTTKRFLELFGLNSLKDLPQPESLKPSDKAG